MHRLAFVLLLSQAAFGQQPAEPAQKTNPAHQLDGIKPIRVGERVADANLISSTPAVMPALARQAGISGDVILQVLIGEDGTVQNIQTLSGAPLLIQAAIESVKTRVYKPTLLEGQPVQVITTATVHF